MLNEKVEEEFFKLNPKVEKDKIAWGTDGKLKWYCEHGKSHTVYAPKGISYNHDCDDCCKAIKPYDPQEQENETDLVAEEHSRWNGS